jgi:hypothetical protein
MSWIERPCRNILKEGLVVVIGREKMVSGRIGQLSVNLSKVIILVE